MALSHPRGEIHPAHQSPQAHLGLQFYLEKKMKTIRPHTVTIRKPAKPIVYMAWTVGENPLDGHYHATKPATIRTKRIPAWKSPTLQRR